MDKLLSFADKMLKLLPFDGDKTVIGAGLKLVLPMVVAKVPVLLVVAPALDALAGFLISSGLAHKLIKRKMKQ